MDLALRNIPRIVKIFFIRGLALFILWKLLYLLVLEPMQFPDIALTKLLIVATTKVLSLFHPGSYFVGNSIYSGTGTVIRILPPCNGLEVMVLYSGFILAMPTVVKSSKRKFIFILSGVIGIFAFNIIRCVTLSLISFQYPQVFEFSHKYMFNLLVYSFMILTWSYYCKNKKYVL